MRSNKVLFISLALFSASILLLVLISTEFAYTAVWEDTQVYTYVASMIFATMCFFAFCYLLHAKQSASYNVSPENKVSKSTATKTSSIKWLISIRSIFVIGLLARIIFIPTNAVLEDDFYRYFFDGELLTLKANPYKHAPNDFLNDSQGLLIQEPSGLLQDKEKPVVNSLVYRVAYPDISTIYPPVAQFFFALSSYIAPYDLSIWRSLLLLFEIISFYLLVKLLTVYRRPIYFISLYWLNPLLIVEGINAAHMDVILVPFILASLLMIQTQRYTLAGALLAAAVGVKLWPVLLVPFAVVYIASKYERGHRLHSILGFCFAFASLTILLLLPQLLSLSSQSGLQQYSQYWQVNSFIFSILDSGLVAAYELSTSDWLVDPNELSRLLVSLTILIFIGKQSLSHLITTLANKNVRPHDPLALANHWFWLAFLLFILSPTGYPWYAFWFMPLLCLSINRTNWPILLLSMSLHLYDLRYPEPSAEVFETWIVTITFLPVLAALLWLQYKHKNEQHVH
ncbi:hypothetical protein [Agaribacter flavus]|uniref:DUF2029 domain-containing protein n=1 Tax=Agaribacter flavus TaxID=1902781 RepID=A0ABV7FRC4_9ALTE